ncbi:hypothetical protein PCANC_12858 [Puccinia coronata f. sp. avenae]|uniref:superoxide dismutase n=1 Tax=Puccinia coronata f. sp. avenae TaxID=200324 RepID=A0A2N5SPM0_9BASI|nr:hypothetical protein PCANC_12858 [Puccinia coronata f. sp. avenae]
MLSPFFVVFALFINANWFSLTKAEAILTSTRRLDTKSQNMDTPALAANATSILTATANLTGHFNVSGQIRFALQPESNAVAVSILMNGLNALNSTAAYAYHIHTNPISSDGNCTSALGHLDPLAVTDGLACNPQFAQYCQEGDLSGRHGKLNGSEAVLNLSYIDDYLRFWPQPFSILGRSVVVHLPNSTRIACGNITSAVDGTAAADGTPTFVKSNYTTQYSSHAPPAPPTKYEPFNGSTPNPAVLSQITLPSSLPTVEALPNVILGTNSTTHIVNGKTEPITLPAAINATTPFNYTTGAILPSQNDTSIINSTTDGSNGDGSAKKGASSGAGTVVPSIMFHGLASLCLLMFL